MRCYIRIFLHPISPKDSHSYLIAAELGGLTARIEPSLHVDETTTIKKLRTLIETKIDREMMRRSPLYEEILDACRRSANPYEYEEPHLMTYRLGIYPHGIDPETPALPPTLISTEDESKGVLVVDYFEDYTKMDVIVVPASQIDPDGVCKPAS